MRRLLIPTLCLAALPCLVTPASANEPAPGAVETQAPMEFDDMAYEQVWTLSAGIGAVFSLEEPGVASGDEVDSDSFGGSLGLDWSNGRLNLGLVGGISDRETDLGDNLRVTDGGNFSVGGYAVYPVGPVDASLSVDYARERTEAVSDANPGLGLVGLEQTTDGFSITASASRVFGERTRIVPIVLAGWSTTETRTEVTSPVPFIPDFDTGQSEDGFYGGAGASVGYDVAGWVSIYGSALINAAQSEGAVWRQGAGRRTRVDGTISSDLEDSVTWGEFGAGIVVFRNQISVSFDTAVTAGLVGDYVSTGMTVSRSF